MPHYDAEVTREVLDFIAEGHSQGEASRRFGVPQSTVSRWLKEQRQRNTTDTPTTPTPADTTVDTPSTGHLPAIPSVHSSAPERISALTVHYDASEVDHLRARVATLEAFMAASESQQRPSAPQRIDSAPAHSDALERIHEALARLDTRLHVVEASQPLSALPAHSDAPAHRIAPERTKPPTWVNRGTHFAKDMLDAIDTYAQQHRLEKREVLDLALRSFFAQVGEGVRDA